MVRNVCVAGVGASGGAAAEKRIIAPQFIPISQLVLIAMKCRRELRMKSE